MRRLVDEAYETARKIITEKNKEFNAVAEALLEYETLSGEEILALINEGKQPVRPPSSLNETYSPQRAHLRLLQAWFFLIGTRL